MMNHEEKEIQETVSNEPSFIKDAIHHNDVIELFSIMMTGINLTHPYPYMAGGTIDIKYM